MNSLVLNITFLLPSSRVTHAKERKIIRYCMFSAYATISVLIIVIVGDILLIFLVQQRHLDIFGFNLKNVKFVILQSCTLWHPFPMDVLSVLSQVYFLVLLYFFFTSLSFLIYRKYVFPLHSGFFIWRIKTVRKTCVKKKISV